MKAILLGVLLKMKSKIFLGGMGLIMLAVLGSFMFVSCRSFKPIWIDGQPDECNDFLTMLSFYHSVKSGDNAFIGTVYNECKTARAEGRQMARQSFCKELWFGDDQLDRRDNRYVNYLECVAGK